MPTTPRPVGKFGRLPGKVPVGLRELGFYAAGPLPSAPAAVTAPDVGDWQMLANDVVGDCGVAGLQHGFMADAAVAGEHESFPNGTQAKAFYLAYTGGQDSGVVLADYLAYVRQHRYYDHTVDSFAPVNVHDVPTLAFATFAFGFTYCGIVVTETMQRTFAAREPWEMATLTGPVAGGHCVPVVGYDDTFITVVTWGAVQPVSWPAWHHMATEAYAVVTGELVAAEGDGARGVTLEALRADLDRLN